MRILRSLTGRAAAIWAVVLLAVALPALVLPAVAGASAFTIKVTDVRDTAMVVSWTTTTAVTGSVKYGPAVGGSCSGVTLALTAVDKRGASTASTLHYVQLAGLVPGSYPAYCVQAVSGSDSSDVTLVTLGATFTSPPAPEQVYGTLTVPGQSVVEAIVYATATGANGTSSVISALVSVDDEGYWLLDIGSFRTSTLAAVYSYTNATALAFDVIGSSGQVVSGFGSTVEAARSGSLVLLMEVTPTSTATATPTSTATATPTSTATATSTSTATATSTSTATATSTSTATATS
ncbi:MAG: hypothetical protein ACKO2D_00035, partial [Chloroflexota bacterium]